MTVEQCVRLILAQAEKVGIVGSITNCNHGTRAEDLSAGDLVECAQILSDFVESEVHSRMAAWLKTAKLKEV